MYHSKKKKKGALFCVLHDKSNCDYTLVECQIGESASFCMYVKVEGFGPTWMHANDGELGKDDGKVYVIEI